MKKIIIVVIAILALGGGGFLVFRKSAAPKPAVPFVHDPGEYFITDVKGSKCLLKTDIMIEASDDKMKVEIEEDNFRIRDAIIFILRAKTEEELKTPGIETRLNDEIVARLNAVFETDVFAKIYFNEFVIQ